ncbi:MAG: leucine-rich repeat domain-containing protein, partial [Eubacteriales bacterium]|nr:leucine-rich repeat domain-containing protein [Eubacteriales bacterium]
NKIECTAFELDLNSDITITGDMEIKVLYDYDWEVKNNDTITITGFYNDKERYDIPETIGGKPVKTIGDGTKKSSNKMFKNNTQKRVDISAPSVESIADYAFKGFSNLKTIDIPNVISIGASAFTECNNLEGILLNGEVVINNNESGEVFSPETFVGIYRVEEPGGRDEYKGSWNAREVAHYISVNFVDEDGKPINNADGSRFIVYEEQLETSPIGVNELISKLNTVDGKTEYVKLKTLDGTTLKGNFTLGGEIKTIKALAKVLVNGTGVVKDPNGNNIGEVNSEDKVTSNGKPIINPDGTIKFPEGGTITKPGGSIIEIPE